MKKYFILLTILFAALSARAQFVGDVSITRRELCERNGELYMNLEVGVSGNSLTRSQSWMIIPELSTSDRQSVKLFPHILINGKYQRHMQERRRKLLQGYWVERQPYTTINAKRGQSELIRYQMSVPYESWMDEATLVVRQILISPGDVRRVFTVDVNGAVDKQ